MASTKNFIKEAVQFAPIITLASSFIVSGGVDIERAGALFVVSGAMALVITAVLIRMEVLLNPILIGTNLWLCLGAVAFGVPVVPFAEAMGALQAVGLYACTLGVAVVFTALVDTGYIGMSHPKRNVVLKLSIAMAILTAVSLVWSAVYIDSIRLGGALPFIILNVTRRVLIRRSRTIQQTFGK